MEIRFPQNEDYSFKLSMMPYMIWPPLTSLTSRPIILPDLHLLKSQ